METNQGSNNPTAQATKAATRIATRISSAIGAIALILIAFFIFGHKNKASFNISPASGREGTEISISYDKEPASSANIPAGALVTVQFSDPGEHGWHMVTGGAATYVTYDPTKGLTYKAQAESVSSSSSGYKVIVPQGICGLIIQAAQAKPAGPKILDVSILGADGKPLPGTSPAKFSLTCDKYTLNVKIKANPEKVLPDGVSQSTVTANLSVTGPAQIVIGQKITKPTQPIIITSPIGLVMVNFHTNLGILNPNPSNVKTDLSGNATVTITSADAGIAKVQAVAEGIGDAIANVKFEPKITGVKQDFVQPNSPTNDEIATIPANPKDLDFHWEIIYPAGQRCGRLTGPADGHGLNKNGYYHGPADGYPDGCDQKYEAAVQIKVTVTDKDGQSDTKVFPARAYEGQGLVKLP